MNGRDIEPRGTSYPLDRRGCQRYGEEAKHYFDLGFISSYLEITKTPKRR